MINVHAEEEGDKKLAGINCSSFVLRFHPFLSLQFGWLASLRLYSFSFDTKHRHRVDARCQETVVQREFTRLSRASGSMNQYCHRYQALLTHIRRRIEIRRL